MLTLVLSAVVASQSAGSIAAPVSLRFKATSMPIDTSSVLGDVVDIQTDDVVVRNRLNHLSLGPAPMPGRRVTLNGEWIGTTIRISFPEIQNPLTWQGPSSATFLRPAVDHPLSVITVEASGVLDAWLQTRYDRFQSATLETISHDIRTSSAASLSYEVRGSEATRRMAVWVTIHEPGLPDRALPIWFKVDAFAEGWVANASLASGREVGPHVLHRETVDVTEHANALPADFVFEKAMAIKPIPEGAVVTRAMLSEKPAIVTGDRVRMRIRQGTVEIEAMGIAEQSAGIGQRVRMRNERSGESLSAKVIDVGLVEALP